MIVGELGVGSADYAIAPLHCNRSFTGGKDVTRHDAIAIGKKDELALRNTGPAVARRASALRRSQAHEADRIPRRQGSAIIGRTIVHKNDLKVRMIDRGRGRKTALDRHCAVAHRDHYREGIT